MRNHIERIKRDIVLAQNNQVHIRRGDWFTDDLDGPGVCALGACLLVDNKFDGSSLANSDDRTPETRCANMFGVRVREINAFVDGFDGSKRSNISEDEVEAYKVGQEIAQFCGFGVSDTVPAPPPTASYPFPDDYTL